MRYSIQTSLNPVRHGLALAVLALITGALWAAFLAVNHEQMHGDFEQQEQTIRHESVKNAMHDMSMDSMNLEHGVASAATTHSHASGDAQAHAAKGQHTHSGSLASDAMQRLLRGHIHFMGLGVLAAVLLLITAFTSLKPGWKKLLGWTFGVGAMAYPPAWILMGLRTVELGPQAAEASVMWLFGPSVGLLLASMSAVLGILVIEIFSLQSRIPFLSVFFEGETAETIVKRGNP